MSEQSILDQNKRIARRAIEQGWNMDVMGQLRDLGVISEISLEGNRVTD